MSITSNIITLLGIAVIIAIGLAVLKIKIAAQKVTGAKFK
jgi:hypothetical protein